MVRNVPLPIGAKGHAPLHADDRIPLSVLGVGGAGADLLPPYDCRLEACWLGASALTLKRPILDATERGEGVSVLDGCPSRIAMSPSLATLRISDWKVSATVPEDA